MRAEIDAVILASVPHRAPILRVHRVQQVAGDQATVIGSEPTGDGALPWACGAIEGLAQSAAVLLAGRQPGAAPAAPRAGMLVAVKRFHVIADPAPGQPITYRVHLQRQLGPTALLHGHAEQDGRQLASGELMLWTAGPT